MQFIDDHLKISRVMCTKGKLFQLGFQPFKTTWYVYVDLLVLISWNLPMTIKISGTRLWRCSTGLHWLEQRCIFHRNPWVLCQGQSQKIPPSQYDKNWLNIIHAQHVIRCCSSCSVVPDSLQPHGPQHARLPCPSPSPGACSNPCPLSRWCHPTISSSVTPFSSCPQSFPASGTIPVSRLFASGSLSMLHTYKVWYVCDHHDTDRLVALIHSQQHIVNTLSE